MNSDELKKADRKAMPKFILILVISILIGVVIGVSYAKYGLEALADGIKTAGAFFGMYIAPWLMLAIAVIMPVVYALILRSIEKLSRMWDGENEDILYAANRKFSVVIWLTSAAHIVSYFLITAAYSGGLNEKNVLPFIIALIAFLAIMIEVLIIQKKCVDAVRKSNPEKNVSFFDTKFHRKWEESCDEAEKALIGKCAFRAYTATNTVCSILAVVLAVCALVLDIGFLPSLSVCLIWIINLSVYCRETLIYSKAGKKIS